MRMLLAGLLVLGVFVGGLPASEAAPRKAKTVKAKTARIAYVCPGCGTGSSRPVPCPLCKSAMGHVATYGCLTCHISANHTAPCPNCREPMTKVAARYHPCAACGYYRTKSKKACPVCAKKRKKKA